MLKIEDDLKCRQPINLLQFMSHFETIYCFNSCNKSWIKLLHIANSGQIHPADSRTGWDSPGDISASGVPSAIKRYPLEEEKVDFPSPRTVWSGEEHIINHHYSERRLQRLTTLLGFFLFFDIDYDCIRCAYTHGERCDTDEVCCFISQKKCWAAPAGHDQSSSLSKTN